MRINHGSNEEKSTFFIENFEDEVCIEIKDGSFIYHIGPLKEFLAAIMITLVN